MKYLLFKHILSFYNITQNIRKHVCKFSKNIKNCNLPEKITFTNLAPILHFFVFPSNPAYILYSKKKF